MGSHGSGRVSQNSKVYGFLVAGTVGGILANSTRPAEFIYDNMMIHATVVHAAHLYDVRKLLEQTYQWFLQHHAALREG